MSAAIPSDFDPENAQNLEEIEKQFAVRAVQEAQTYWSLLGRIKGSQFHFTNMDPQIYEEFIEAFPEYSTAESVAVIDEDVIKSPTNKRRWHAFISKYEKTVKDYNFGTLLRTDVKAEYGESTTMLSVRMQFIAFEIARNRHNLNDWIYEATQ
ncbi:putative polysaccharide biosynthesis protein [Lipomyces oligophaga]|uniref:putative polysaccharide biosynthesis protein n=1 Tax=Lipomyces oligophaga TaxID=45792 RepID=UPI0034CFF966